VTSTGERRRGVSDAVVVSAALIGSNAAMYLLAVLAARMLVPAAFGELASQLNVLVVGVVPAMGVQMAVALKTARTVAAGESWDSRTGSTFGLGLRAAVIASGCGLLATPGLVALLHLESAAAPLCLAAALFPLTLIGTFHGILQGSRRFTALARLVALEGIGKAGGALSGLLIAGSAAGALAGIAVGTSVVAVIGWITCHRPRLAAPERGSLSAVLHAVAGLAGIIVLVNLDLVLARHELPAAAAGGYAVGAIVTKIAYWLPQAIGVLALPRLAEAHRKARTVMLALGLCAAINVLFVGGTLLFPGLVVRLVGGAQYADAGLPMWLFALTGSLFSLVQLLLYSRIASSDRATTIAVWAAVAIELVLVTQWLNGSPQQVVTAAMLTGVVLFAVGAAIEVVKSRREGSTHRVADRVEAA
jgi:O-antigen/teichoic acid export membrane protein